MSRTDPDASQTTNLIGDLIIVKDMDHLIDPRKSLQTFGLKRNETMVRKIQENFMVF